MLLPLDNQSESDIMVASIGPFWDANETWLVLAIGLLLIAFPQAHSLILKELYIPASVMLIGLILRGVAFDFRAKASFGHKPSWDKAFKFGYDVEFEVESYLNYQGERFSENFDANTYLLMTRALDYFDPAKEYDGLLEKALKKALCKFMVISFSTDWRFSPERSQILVDELVKADKSVSYTEIDAPHGHDAFLIPTPRYMDVFTAFMNRVAKECY